MLKLFKLMKGSVNSYVFLREEDNGLEVTYVLVRNFVSSAKGTFTKNVTYDKRENGRWKEVKRTMFESDDDEIMYVSSKFGLRLGLKYLKRFSVGSDRYVIPRELLKNLKKVL